MSTRTVLVSVVLFLFTSSMAHANLVASTPGEFSVSSTGAASYSVPIIVSPGTAGVEPKLSLNYSSQGGNGLLGVGWMIGGLSVIHRCPTNLVKDGFIDGIDFDDNDRFCLDGQPLLAINGIYGADGTEYRTEINNFSKVISYDSNGDGPDYFKVWTKSGEIMEYGNTNNSYINPPNADGTTPQNLAICWLLNRIEDTVGNYMTITYFEDTSTGENYPERIDYTGNTGLTPYNSVEFSYETRTDAGARFLAGLKMESTKRLSTIESKNGTNTTRKYELTYQYSDGVEKSQITDIQECDKQNVCVPKTNFDYANASLGEINTATHSQPAPYSYMGYYAPRPGDFDGDGLTDIAWIYDDSGGAHTYISLSNGDGTMGSVIHSNPGTGQSFAAYAPQPGDYNGDGLTDIAWTYDGSAGIHTFISLSNGDGTMGSAVYSNPGTGQSYASYAPQPGDYNGDGLTDIAWTYDGSAGIHTFVSLSNGDGTMGSVIYSNPGTGQSYDAYAPQPGDYNGDGITDIAWTHGGSSGAHAFVSISNGDGTFSSVIYSNPNTYNQMGQYSPRRGDFNGDGLTDIAWTYDGSSLATYVSLSQGDGTMGPAIFSSISSGQNFNAYTPRLGDFNGDGLSDITWTYGGSGAHTFVSLANGDGTMDVAVYSNPAPYSYMSYYPPHSGDFNGDGITDIAWVYSGSSGAHVYMSYADNNNGYPGIPLKKITNALEVEINIDYSPLTDDAIYKKGECLNSNCFPVIDIQAAMYVVSESNTDNGIGSQNTLEYDYEGAKAHAQGRGLLGFTNRTVTDVDNNIIIETNYKQNFPYIGQAASTKTTVDGALVSEESNTFAALGNTSTGPAFAYVSPAVSKTYELNGGALLTTVTTNSTYDSYGNPTNISVTTTDVGIDTYTTTAINTYTNNTSLWHLGRLTQAVVTKTGGAQTSLSRTSTFEYNSATGLLTKEIIEPNNTAFKLTKTYSHDSFGNRISVTESGSGISSRLTTTDYDSKGQFPTRATNALGHYEDREYNDSYGNVTKLTGPNNLDTTWEYDSLGRKSREVRADGTETNISYEFCTGSNCASHVNGLASYKITTITTGAATSIAYYDAVNRVILTEAQSFDGTSVFVETKYNEQGRVDRRSNPYFGSTAAYWTDYTYDDLGRVTQEASPTTGTTIITYNGFVTTSLNDLNQTNKEKTNSLGQTLWTEDDNSNKLVFTYDAQGNLITTTDSENNVTNNTYNLRGYKTQMVDPDMGTWSYAYNVLGELTSQTDNKNQTVSMAYDKLGRLVTRTENEGSTTWTYDAATNGVGKLASVSHYGGYSRTHTYDNSGRPDATTTIIGGTSYTTSTSYDPSGRVNEISYPGSSNFKVDHVYNTWGYLKEVRNANNTSEVFYTADLANEFGSITKETYGNNVVTMHGYESNSGRIDFIKGNLGAIQNLEYDFNTIGNLTQRKDITQSLTENFSYDNLNRIKSAVVVGAGTITVKYEDNGHFGDLGNITYKSDVGDYHYAQTGNAGPHAVTSAGGVSYLYDKNGNQTSGNGKIITWSSFNKPTQIQKGSSQSNFTYGPDRARYLQVTTDSSTTTTTTYIGGLYEKVEKIGSTEEKHFIRAGSQTIAIFTNRSSGTDTTEYLHRDHLGTIDTITDTNGNIVEKLSFDAFGKRRLSNWNSGVPSIVSNNTRGFTGHEMLDAVGLIHMNGRVYDPLLGRFMSADPSLQYPKNMQNYNRYSYVHNNPLSFVDPSGFGFFDDVVDFVDDVFDSIGDALSSPVVQAILAVIITIACQCPGAAGLFTSGEIGIAAAAAINAGIAAATTAAGNYVGGLSGSGAVPGPGGARGTSTAPTHGSVGDGPISDSALDARSIRTAADIIKSLSTAGTKSATNEKFANAADEGSAYNNAVNNNEDRRSIFDNPGRFLPSLPQGVVDVIVGFGDGVFTGVTLGLGDLNELREIVFEGGVDKSSDLYKNFYLAGSIQGGFSLGGAVGLLGKGAKGFEFSHFIPQRYIGRFNLPASLVNNQVFNGTYVPRLYHALTDAYRYRFLPRIFKAQVGLTSPIPQGVQQVLRTPPALVGSGVGAINGSP